MSIEYYATDVYTGGGTNFTISFSRDNDSLVQVEFEGVVLAQGVDYTITHNVMTLTTPAVAGEVVAIYRETPIANVVDWNTAKFVSSNLQKEEEHLTDIQQELYDLSTRILRDNLI